MRMSQAFPAKFLKSEDVGNQRWPLTIRDVQMEDVGDNEHKPIVYFYELDKGMVLNKTNADMIVQLYGDETTAWTNQRVELYTTPVQFQGRSTMGLRLMAPAPAMPAHQPMHAPPPGMPNINVPPPAAPGMPDPRNTRPVYPAPNPNAPSDFAQPSQHGQSVGTSAPAPQGGSDLDDEIPF